MQLTHKQQRYIRKNHARKSVQEIARILGVPDHAVSSYLTRITGSVTGKEQTGTSIGESTWLDRISPFWFLLLFTVLVAVIYGVTLPYAFISDDFAYIVDNPRLRDIGYVFQVPLTSAKALLDVAIYKMAGANPVFFRLKNVLFHLGSSWMLFLILRQWKQTLAAAMAGILFLVHPIVTESVTWIGGGGYPQYAFFFLASFYFYIGKNGTFRSVVLPAVFFLLMLLSSEKSVSLSLAYPLYELSRGTVGKNWKRTIPYLFMSAVWVLLILFVFRYTQTRIQTLETSFYHETGAYYNPLIQIPTAITTYLSLIFWPAMLSFYQSELTTGTLGYMYRVAGLLGYAAVTVAAYRMNKSVFFFLMLFAVSLLPMLTPLKIGWVVAERYVYLGSAAVIAALSVAVAVAAGKRRSRTLFGVVFSIITLALVTRTMIRNSDWQNQDTLWIATGKTAPTDPKTHNNLGDLYGRRGDLVAAKAEFELAVKIDPRYADAYHNLGNVFMQMKEPDKARESYEKALSFNPTLWQSHQAIAVIAFEGGAYDEAAGHLESAILLQPVNPVLHENLGIIYMKAGKKEQAAMAFEKALSLDPGNPRVRSFLESMK